jgi:hypothetical protein
MPDGRLRVEDLEEPEADGTVARGWIEHGGRTPREGRHA